MHFAPEYIGAFREIFSSSEERIRTFPGCLALELIENKDDKFQLCTLSRWESENALEQYRQSELFKQTWSKTKVLFDQKPKATSFIPAS